MRIKTLLVILIVVAVLGVSYALLSKNQTEPASEAVPSTAEAVAKALGAKYDRPVESVQVSVTSDTGTFAKGSVSFDGEPGGGLWFAAKTATGWELAHDGYGIIPCSAANTFDFPTTMVPQCIDTDRANELVQRAGEGAGGNADKSN